MVWCALPACDQTPIYCVIDVPIKHEPLCDRCTDVCAPPPSPPQPCPSSFCARGFCSQPGAQQEVIEPGGWDLLEQIEVGGVWFSFWHLVYTSIDRAVTECLCRLGERGFVYAGMEVAALFFRRGARGERGFVHADMAVAACSFR